MYEGTARFYDRMTADVEYPEYARYFERIFLKHADEKPSMVMDLGCGTGNFTLAMANLGYDMTGVDSSLEMLNEAYVKKGPGVLWINQKLTELDLFGTYDAAVSLLDCVNHMTKKNEVEKYFKLIHNYLNPGGLFVFDINTEYKFKHVFAGNVFYSVEEDFAYIWQNHYDLKTGLCEMDITVFNREDDLYTRNDETNTERSYSAGEMADMLENAGFSIEATYGDGTLEKPDEKEERVFFVCRKGM